MSHLTVFLNVFFRNQDSILGYYESVRNLIGSHKPVFLINNVSAEFDEGPLRSVGQVVYVDEILNNNKLTGIEQFLSSKNSRYVRHFFAGVACCDTEFFSFFDPDNICADYAWVAEAQTLLRSNGMLIAASPYWSESPSNPGCFFDTGFSDQLFVGVASRFKSFDYSLDSIYSWRYPLRQNGATFESAVFSNMLKNRLKRAVLSNYSYSHANEGSSYAKRDWLVGVKRSLARSAWNIREKLYRDKSYE